MTADSLLAAVQFRRIVAVVLLCIFLPIFIGVAILALQALSIAIATPPLDVGPHFGTALTGSLAGAVTGVVMAVVGLFKDVFGPPPDAIKKDKENELVATITSLAADAALSEENAQRVLELLNLKPLDQVRTL